VSKKLNLRQNQNKQSELSYDQVHHLIHGKKKFTSINTSPINEKKSDRIITNKQNDTNIKTDHVQNDDETSIASVEDLNNIEQNFSATGSRYAKRLLVSAQKSSSTNNHNISPTNNKSYFNNYKPIAPSPTPCSDTRLKEKIKPSSTHKLIFNDTSPHKNPNESNSTSFMERLSTKPNKMNVNEFLSLNAPVTPKSKNKKDNSSQNDLTPTSALRLDLANKFTISTPPEEKEKKEKNRFYKKLF